MNRVPLNPPVKADPYESTTGMDNHNPDTMGFKVLRCLYCLREFPIVNHLTAMGDYWQHMAQCSKENPRHDTRQQIRKANKTDDGTN